MSVNADILRIRIAKSSFKNFLLLFSRYGNDILPVPAHHWCRYLNYISIAPRVKQNNKNSSSL